MIGQAMTDAVNEQINAEIYSAYLYFSMAAYFRDRQLGGFAHWMEAQAQEEMVHALKLYAHLCERGGRALMKGIEAPPTDWPSPLAVFQHTLAHERKVTGLIHALVAVSRREGDYAADNFLQWYVAEQMEEEESAGKAVKALERIGEDSAALFALDREMAKRPAPYQRTPPAGG